MKRYQTYKPSGIEWLGEIPEDWEVRRLKDISIVATGSRNTEDKLDDGKYPFFVRSQTVEYIDTYSFNGEAILTAGDGVGVAKVFHHYIGKFETHQRVYRISNFPKCNGRFLFYFLMENVYKEVLKFNVKSTVDSLRMPMFLQFPVLLPTKSAQTAIANYLDTKTAAIDRKIELLTAKADKYKALRRSLINKTVCRGLNPNAPLKDSGIEWIGMIPEHWEVKRVKDLLYLLTGNSISDKTDFEDSNNSIPYVATKDIELNSCKIDYENGIYIPKNELKNFKPINPNSILLCIEGGSAGKKIAFNTRRICFVNKLCSFSSKGNAVDIKYNFYQMQSAPWLFQFNQVLNGLIGGVSISLLKTFRLITPSRNEQAEIAIYLDNKTTQIDTILNNINEQITKLTQLRKTLINDVVTGKIKVTGRELI